MSHHRPDNTIIKNAMGRGRTLNLHPHLKIAWKWKLSRRNHRTKWFSIACIDKLLEKMQSAFFELAVKKYSRFFTIPFSSTFMSLAADVFSSHRCAASMQPAATNVSCVFMCFCACKRLVLRLNLLPSSEQCDLVQRNTPGCLY